MPPVIAEVLLILVVAAVLFWALPQLGWPDFVRVLAIVFCVVWVALVVLRGPMIF